MKKAIILHPFLFAIQPVLFLFSYNRFETIFLKEIFILIGANLIFSILILISINIFLKSIRKSAVIASVFIFQFFSFMRFFGLIVNFKIGNVNVGRLVYFYPIWILFFILVTCFIVRFKREFLNVTVILNIIAASLVIFNLYNIARGKHAIIVPDKIESARNKFISSPKVKDFKQDNNKYPDIYYIIFDRYAGYRTLKDFFNYDNSDFIDYLTRKGFYVARDSNTNYLHTFKSLSSSLNMDYLKESSGNLDENWYRGFNLLQDYKIWRFLKSKGYIFIHFGSWGLPTKVNRFADVNFDHPFLRIPRFSFYFLNSTMLFPLTEFFYICKYRKFVLDKFDSLAKVAEIEGPKFVFAHFLITHSPYCFGPKGELLTYRQILKKKKKNHKEKYLNNLIFTNTKIKQLLERILSKSEGKPAIILQSDEGPLEFVNLSKEKIQLSAEELRLCFGILNAYYLPDLKDNILYPNISPVNSFRVIFNLYFGTNYELLEDKHFVSEGDYYSFRFVEVTDKLKGKRKGKEMPEIASK